MASISDVELRQKLESHGVNVGPITDSTRNVYLKKLAKLPSNKNPGRASTGRQSSPGRSSVVQDAEDDLPSNRRRSKRTQPPAPTRRSAARAPPIQENDSSNSEEEVEKKTTITPRKSGRLAGATTPNRATGNANGQTSSLTGTRRQSQATPMGPPSGLPPSTSKASSRHSVATVNGMPGTSTGYRTSASFRTTPQDPHVVSSSSRWSRAPISTPTSTRQEYAGHTPGWMSWLSRGAATSHKKDDDALDVSDADFSDAEGAANRMRSRIDAGTRTSTRLLFTPPSAVSRRSRGDMLEEHDDEDYVQESSSWSRHVPNLLLISLLVLAVVLLGVYMVRMDTHRSQAKERELAKMYCRSDELASGSQETTSCFKKEDVSEAVRTIRVLFDILSEHAGEFYCRKAHATSTRLPVADVRSLMEHRGALSDSQWSVVKHVVTKMGYNYYDLASYSAKGDLLSADSDPNLMAFLECLSPRIPIGCRVFYKLGQMVSLARATAKWIMDWLATLVILAVTLGILGVVAKVTHWVWQYRHTQALKRREEIGEVVMAISRLLQEALRKHEHDREIPEYISLDQIRVILSKGEHKRVGEGVFWENVKQHVYDQEPSIGMQDRRGLGEVWMWRGGTGWQGSAVPDHSRKVPFDIPPTECLKIRNMFNGPVDDEGKDRLRREILKQCSTLGDICHVGIDTQGNEGFVYMKCASVDTAGNAFRKIHANYFDGKLLTVKFLRADKYHRRFPEALSMTTPLRSEQFESRH